MIAFFSNLYKNDPIKFLLIIAVTYLLLKQSNVIESFKPSNVDGTIDVTAISNVSQLAQKINKAFIFTVQKLYPIFEFSSISFNQINVKNGRTKILLFCVCIFGSDDVLNNNGLGLKYFKPKFEAKVVEGQR